MSYMAMLEEPGSAASDPSGKSVEASRSEPKPLLEGSLGVQALDTVKAIARDIPRPDEPHSETRRSLGLSHGHAGWAVFFAHLHQAGVLDPLHAKETAVAHLDVCLDGLADEPMGPSLFGGFTGIAWALRHISQLGTIDNDDDSTEVIDETLSDLLSADPWPFGYDLVEGLCGFGIYALGDGRSPMARECARKVLDQLERLAETVQLDTGDGITWHTPPRLLPDHQRQEAPLGYYNLGVAHGVAGILPFLAGLYSLGIEGRRAAALLDGAVAWLLAQEQSSRGSHSAFANWVGPQTQPQDSRLAWCYGDAGIATALLCAARAVGRKNWQLHALRFARRAAFRPAEDCWTEDAGFCHGTAGLAHLFHRLYRWTGDPLLAEAARDWIQRTLDFRKPGEGIGGFKSWSPSAKSWRDDPSLLTGSAGIGLVLLAAATTHVPSWDSALACSTADGRDSQKDRRPCHV